MVFRTLLSVATFSIPLILKFSGELESESRDHIDLSVSFGLIESLGCIKIHLRDNPLEIGIFTVMIKPQQSFANSLLRDAHYKQTKSKRIWRKS